jgi:putative Mg2+ transporter-C (MgtC) family protein
VASLQDQVFVGLDDPGHYLRVAVRLTVALLLGAALGYERQETGKSAGLRTHMLVAIGAALFVLAAVETGAEVGTVMRVVQGLTMGIGFLGAGAIIRGRDERHVHGLTTAANLWVTAALGTAVGLGFVWPAAYTAGLALLTLVVLRWFEPRKKDGGHTG